jgi:hypothetical protein
MPRWVQFVMEPGSEARAALAQASLPFPAGLSLRKPYGLNDPVPDNTVVEGKQPGSGSGAEAGDRPTSDALTQDQLQANFAYSPLTTLTL